MVNTAVFAVNTSECVIEVWERSVDVSKVDFHRIKPEQVMKPLIARQACRNVLHTSAVDEIYEIFVAGYHNAHLLHHCTCRIYGPNGSKPPVPPAPHHKLESVSTCTF